MKVIYKYHLSNGISVIEMEKKARLLSVDNQNEELMLWAAIEKGAEKEKRKFMVLETGKEYADEFPMLFLGTVMFDDGSYVVHVFEILGNGG